MVCTSPFESTLTVSISYRFCCSAELWPNNPKKVVWFTNEESVRFSKMPELTLFISNERGIPIWTLPSLLCLQPLGTNTAGYRSLARPADGFRQCPWERIYPQPVLPFALLPPLLVSFPLPTKVPLSPRTLWFTCVFLRETLPAATVDTWARYWAELPLAKHLVGLEWFTSCHASLNSSMCTWMCVWICSFLSQSLTILIMCISK